MNKYVAGFLFSPDLMEVVLITKEKPTWQAGKLNAVGGKIEGWYGRLHDELIWEEPISAMAREFAEETGLEIKNWKSFCLLEGGEANYKPNDPNRFSVEFFYAISENYKEVTTVESEKVDIYNVLDVLKDIAWSYSPSVKDLYLNATGITLPNIGWLLNMALTIITKKETCKRFVVTEQYE